MRIFIGILCCCLCSMVEGQDYDFSIGATYQPFFYKNYNEADWNNRPQSYPDNPARFNGFAVGLTAEKTLSETFSLMAELTYSEQSQDHRSTNWSLDAPPDGGPPNNVRASTFFNILKLPVAVSVNKELGYNSGLYARAYLGGQISFLTHYKSTYRVYNYDIVKNQVNWDFLTNELIKTPEFSDQKIWDNSLNPPGYRENDHKTRYLYNRLLFGVVGGAGLRKTVFSNFIIGIGGRMEYDFTNSEKYPESLHYLLRNRAGNDARTHNIRLGFNLTVQYMID